MAAAPLTPGRPRCPCFAGRLAALPTASSRCSAPGRRAGSARCEPESLDSAYARENILLVSATRGAAPDTAVQISFVNTSLSQAVKLSVKLAGRPPKSMAGSVLTAPPTAARDGFDALNVPQPAAFHGAVLNGRIVEITVPARSVVVLTFSNRCRCP